MKKLFFFIVTLSAMLISTSSTYAGPPGTLVASINVQTRSGVTNVEIEGTLQMIARIIPNNASIKTVMWSVSDPALASIGATTGILTGIALGDVWVIASAIDGSGVKDSMQITVIEKSILVTGVRIFSENGLYEVSVGNVLKLNATVEPDSATDTTLKWSTSDISLATVSQKGNIAALKEGVVWIRAMANDASGIVDSVKITILANIPVTDVIISGDSTVAIGSTTKLKVNVVPDNATDTGVTWSSSNLSIATVSMSGMVSGVAKGFAWIRAISKSAPTIGDSVYMKVTEFIKVTAITITTNTGDTIVGISDTLQMTAVIVPDSATNPDINWTVSNSAIASISAQGMLIGKTAGTVSVSATATDGSGIKKSINIKVVPKPVTSITVSSASDSVAIAKTMAMTAKVLPIDATNGLVNWSVSNGAIASVDASGVVTGIAKGKVNVIATAADGSGISGSKEITVTQFVPVTAITVGTTAGDTVGLGDTLQMTSVITPDTASIKTVTWSVDNSAIASINAAGQLIGKAMGTVVITATATDGSGITGTKSINVVIIPVAGITVKSENDKDTVFVSLDMQMVAIILPDNATDKSVTWTSSNTSIATIDAYTGVLTGIAAGNINVTATAKDGSGITGTKNIKVVSYIPVTTITVTGKNNDSIVSAGNTLQMTAAILPTNASIKTVTWKTSNSLVATIDDNGMLTAVNSGKVLITASADDASGVSGSKVIEVVLKPVTSISVTTLSGLLSVAETNSIQMAANVLPADASNKEVTWTVSDTSKATISASGMLLAKTAGSVIVTAIAKDGSDIFGSVTITITKKIGIEQQSQPSLSVYPNPASDYINIEGEEGKTITIIDGSGRIVLEKRINSEIESVNISNFNSGIFFIQVNNEVKRSVVKFIKQ